MNSRSVLIGVSFSTVLTTVRRTAIIISPEKLFYYRTLDEALIRNNVRKLNGSGRSVNSELTRVKYNVGVVRLLVYLFFFTLFF